MIEVEAYWASLIEFIFICGLIAVAGLGTRWAWKKALKIEREEMKQ